MGYTRSKKTVRKAELYLKKMVAATSTMQFAAEDVVKLAYTIRSAIHASKYFSSEEPFKTYSRLAAKFKIRTSRNYVICELRDQPVEWEVPETKMILDGIFSTLAIIGAAISHKADTMVFPDADPEAIDKKALGDWASKNNYIVVVSRDHVTLTKEEQFEDA